MVAREDYEEKISTIVEDKKKMDEDKSNASYELSAERVIWSEKLKMFQQSTHEQLEMERHRYAKRNMHDD